jgi:hypothetical protein
MAGDKVEAVEGPQRLVVSAEAAAAVGNHARQARAVGAAAAAAVGGAVAASEAEGSAGVGEDSSTVTQLLQ